MRNWIGQTLQDGKYSLDGLLGEGGFGITFRATHHYLKQTVVIKTLNQTMQQSANFAQLRQPFQDEARRLALCLHPNIVRVSDFFEERCFGETPLPFMVMDFIDGQSLDALALSGNHGPLPEAQALNYIQQIGKALAVVHSKGLLHRDIKPQNIMRRRNSEEVILIDFGIAREFQAGEVNTHTTMISPGYAPVEQYMEAAKRTPATDVYGLAATLYSLVTGQVPTASILLHAQPLVAPRSLNPALSSNTNAAILKGMEIDAYNRPQSIVQWLGLLSGEVSPGAIAMGTAAPPSQMATLAVAPRYPDSAMANASNDAAAIADNSNSGSSGTIQASQAPKKRTVPWIMLGCLGLLGVSLGSAIAWVAVLSDRKVQVSSEIKVNRQEGEYEGNVNWGIESESPESESSKSASPQPESPQPESSQAEPAQAEAPKPILTINELPQFPVGSSEAEVEQLLGQPNVSRIGFWPNTEANLYEVIPDQVGLGYIYDRDSRQLRQTEATMDPAIPLATMEEMLDGLLGEPATSEAYQKLEQIRSGEVKRYSFEQGSLKGSIEFTDKGRVYLAVWDADLH
jgi:serine/threonine protein kinase